jgi:hypothetical protein
MLRISHCLDNRLTDGGEVVSLTHFLADVYHLCFVLVNDCYFSCLGCNTLQGNWMRLISCMCSVYESKAIAVTGGGGPQCCETSRIPHFLDNQLTDGDEVVSLTPGRALPTQEDSWYSFLLEVQSTPSAIVQLEGLGKMKNPVTSSGTESATFRLVAYCLKQLRYRLPLHVFGSVRESNNIFSAYQPC